MTAGMSTTRTDALDNWLSELTDGETSMRRLRNRLRAEGTLAADTCPTCQHPTTEDVAHTGHVLAVPTD
jgi:uncharacterized Zn finger protein (UPF0148 family)